MNRTWIGLTLCGLLALPAVLAPAPALAAASQGQQRSAKVDVDVELSTQKAKTKSSATVAMGTEASFTFGDARELKMTVQPADDDSLTVTLSMRQGDKTVVKSRTVTAMAGKAQTIKLGKGRVLSLKLSPKKHRIDLPEGNDPLSGL